MQLHGDLGSDSSTQLSERTEVTVIPANDSDFYAAAGEVTKVLKGRCEGGSTNIVEERKITWGRVLQGTTIRRR